MNNTARKIRKIRENKNLTQEYMTGQLNISQPAYAQLENGKTAITDKKLKKLTEILDVDVSKLLSQEELVLDIHSNTLNDNSSIIKEFNTKNNELYERLLNEKELSNKILSTTIANLKETILFLREQLEAALKD